MLSDFQLTKVGLKLVASASGLLNSYIIFRPDWAKMTELLMLAHKLVLNYKYF